MAGEEKLIPVVKMLQIVGGDADFRHDEIAGVNDRLEEIVNCIKEAGGWIESVVVYPELEAKPGYGRIRIKGYCYQPKTLREVAEEAKGWTF